MDTIRVLIADDQPQVREGLRAVLSLAGSASPARIEIAGEACSGREAVLLARQTQPDVVLMDLEMPGLDGLTATRQIKAGIPAVRVVILSIRCDAEARQAAAAAGADAFIAKGEGYQALLQAVTGGQAATQSNNPSEGEQP